MAGRFILAEVRTAQNIAVGDHVVKEQGLGKRVRPRDKKTAQEMLEWLSSSWGTLEMAWGVIRKRAKYVELSIHHES